jgi:hypothetical protein
VRVTAKRFLHCFTFLSQNERITEKKNYHGLNVWHLETNIVLFVCWFGTVKKYRHNNFSLENHTMHGK